MPSPDWGTPLEQGDFAAALESWAQAFAADPASMEATWLLAEIEERWGDSFFFATRSGAAGHYHATLRALVPQGVQLTSAEENNRRMLAHGRVVNKLYAIDGSGRPRTGHDAQPHPNSRPVPPPVVMEEVPPKPSIAERCETVRQARSQRERSQTPLGQLFRDSGHWRFHDLGRLWAQAGTALAPNWPAEANRAYSWSLHFFGLYNREWSANLPASRWDSDGCQEMAEVQGLIDALGPALVREPCPAWILALLEGDWRGAWEEFGETVCPPELEPLLKLMIQAQIASGSALSDGSQP